MRTRLRRKSAALARCIESLESRQLLATNHLVFLNQPTSTVAGSAIAPSIVVAIEDASNKIVTTDSSNVVMAIKTSTGPTGASLGGTKTIAAVNGVATFTDLTLTAAGSGAKAYAFTATDSSLTAANSSSFAILPAAPSKLAFNAQPSDATAGAAISPAITVDVEDQYGNVVTSNASNVTLSVASGPTGGTLSGTLADGASAGEASFSDISAEVAGDYTITATDGKLTTDTSDTFTIAHDTAAQVAFTTEPVATVAGVTMTAVVAQVEDQFGNLVGNSTATVTLSVVSGPGSITGTKSKAASGGVATFDAISLQTAGTYTLKAASGSLATDKSASFVISPAAAAKLALKQEPANGVAGNPLAPALIGVVEDQYGNVVTTDASKVTAALTTSPEGSKLTGTAIATASKGVATFTGLSLTTTGSYVITLTDGSLTDVATDSFAISPAVGAKLVFGQGPAAVAAGENFDDDITVKVEDKFGNVVSSDASKITIAVNTGPNTSIDGTAVATASSGVADFDDLAFDTAGSYTIKATDGKLTAATSTAFVVSPNDADHLVVGKTPATVVSGAVLAPAITVSVVDAFGNVVTTDTSSVALTIAGGTGATGATLGGTATVAAVKGVATFNTLTLDLASPNGNPYFFLAKDGSLDWGANETGIIVTPAAAAKLVFHKGPSNAKAGATISPAVSIYVEDKAGNIVTADKSKITLNINSPSRTPAPKTGKGVSADGGLPTLGGTVTVAAVNGVATFSDLNLTVAGAYTMTATDGKVTAATSDSFTIAPNTAAQIGFGTQPATVTAGTALTAFTAQVEDAYGNVVSATSPDITVMIASGPESGSIQSGTVKQTPAAGVSTFDDITIDQAGTYTLSAVGTGLTGGSSASFVVTAAAGSQLAILQGPSDATAGVANSPAVTIAVEDAFGNVVASDKSKITASLNTFPDKATLTGVTSATAVNGVATFSGLTLNTAGNYKLGFADGTLTGATSGQFAVTANTPTQLAFGQAPAAAVAGAKQGTAISVKVEDKFGNLVTTDHSKITLATGTVPTGLTAGTVAAAVASGGIATFPNLTFNQTGSYTLKAADAKLTVATSPAFAISAGTEAQVVFVQNPSNAVAGVKIVPGITVQVQDALGNVVTSDSSSVAVAITSGTGPAGATLAGTATIAASKGVATFSDLNISTAGSYRLTATDGSLTASISTPFTVSPAAAAKVAIYSAPAAATAGDTQDPIIVLVQDKFGNLVTTDASKVTVALGGVTGAVMAGTATVTASHGIATFSDLAVKTAGSLTMAFSDGALTKATSDAFTVSPDSAALLAYKAAPAAAKAGATLTAVTVQVEDQFGNLVNTDTSNVVLSLATSPTSSTLAGTKTEAAIAGVATFSDLALQTAGAYTIKAADGSLTAVTSASFVISPATAAKLAIGTDGSDAVAGVAISPAVTVQVEDQYGNVVTTDASKITAAIDTGPTGAKLTGTASATASKGIGTFSTLTLNTAGDYKIKFTDASLTSVDTSTVTISPAAAAKLAFAQQPTAAANGDTLTPAVTVDVLDSFGNIVATNTSNVTLAVVTGAAGATFGGTLTQAAVSGVATFDDLTLDKAGTYTIKSTDGSLTLATSNSFIIS